MTKLLGVLNLILIGVLVYILVYPQIKLRQTLEAIIVYQESIGAVPLFVAEEQGYFDSTRVKVEVREAMFGTEGVDEVAKGKAQLLIGVNWQNALFKMAARPEAYRVVLSSYFNSDNPYLALVSLRKKRIKKLKDLELKRVGFPKDSRLDFLLKDFLRKNNVDVDKMSFIGLLTSELDSALEKNFADALLVPEPFRSLLLNRKSVRLVEDGILTKNYLNPFPTSLALTSIVNLNLNKEKLKRIVNALEMSLNYIRENPEYISELIRDRFAIEDTTVPIHVPEFMDYRGIEPARLQKLVDALKSSEILLVDIDPHQIILQPSEIK